MRLAIPELSLVVLMGASSSGKSTFARRHFRPTEVLSSDAFRALIADDENDLSATNEAFEALHFVAAKRLAAGRLVVVDATNVQPEARAPLVRLAREYHCLPVALVFDLPEKLCQERNRTRTDRTLPAYAIRRQVQQLRRSLRGLSREGFRQIYTLTSAEDADAAVVERVRMWTDLRHEHGPFDIVGDVHGCFDELMALLAQLGYDVRRQGDAPAAPQFSAAHPEGRTLIFLGDLADRGPKAPDTLRLVMDLVEAGLARCVPGNHDQKLLRALRGRNVQITHGLGETLAQLNGESAEFKERLVRFLDGLISHYVLDDGRLVVAHAGMREEMQGRASGRVRDFALYGETTGETDEFGLPIRYNWAEEYRGRAMVVYGHTPVPDPVWLNRTINIDMGCVFGGRLTALRYPEKELVSVPAARTSYQSAKPFLPDAVRTPAPEAAGVREDLLDIEDVLGKRRIATRLHGEVTIREEQAHAALEVMSRFAIDPRWLIYLPPTMSPTETSAEPGLLEHPKEAFGYYLHQGIARVICQEKHMGSRAVIVLCRDDAVARRRFAVSEERAGVCYTRTGRPFFGDAPTEAAVLQRVRDAMTGMGLWEELQTDWLCLDCEVMPWSAKAEGLLRDQFASVGTAARVSLGEAAGALGRAGENGVQVAPLRERVLSRADVVSRYVETYRRYCWPVDDLADLRIAPFHLLAGESGVNVARDHLWHMDVAARLAQVDREAHSAEQILSETPYRVVDLTDELSREKATRWWEALTARGIEGVVVKPVEFVARGQRGILQPALKVRGRDYLRIIYGPQYTEENNLTRLRSRGVGKKRSLAVREFALGVEALERFVRKEPLYRVHECVFGVLALESEPVDPQL